VLDALERERDFALAKAFFEASEQAADYRAATLMAQLHNTSGFADEGHGPDHYYVYFRSLRTLTTTDASGNETMDTAQSVEYMRKGFSLYLPR